MNRIFVVVMARAAVILAVVLAWPEGFGPVLAGTGATGVSAASDHRSRPSPISTAPRWFGFIASRTSRSSTSGAPTNGPARA